MIHFIFINSHKHTHIFFKALLERMQVNKLPESLLDETVKDRFSNMLMDFKEQGSTEEQLKEMATPEKLNFNY